MLGGYTLMPRSNHVRFSGATRYLFLFALLGHDDRASRRLAAYHAAGVIALSVLLYIR